MTPARRRCRVGASRAQLSGVRSALAGVLVAATIGLAAGCAESRSSAADDVPALTGLLAKVDTAIVDGRYVVARRQLDALVDATVASLKSGELEESQADEILAAAAQVRALLPEGAGQSVDDPVTLAPNQEETSGGEGGGDGGRDGGRDGGDRDGSGDGDKDRQPGKGHGPGGKGKGRGQR